MFFTDPYMVDTTTRVGQMFFVVSPNVLTACYLLCCLWGTVYRRRTGAR